MEQIDQYNHLQICIVNICSEWRQSCCIIIILYTSSRDNIHHPKIVVCYLLYISGRGCCIIIMFCKCRHTQLYKLSLSSGE